MLTYDTNIRLWKQEVLADANFKYTQLAVQLVNLISRQPGLSGALCDQEEGPACIKKARRRAIQVITKTTTR